MNIKKYFVLIICAALAISVCACQNKSGTLPPGTLVDPTRNHQEDGCSTCPPSGALVSPAITPEMSILEILYSYSNVFFTGTITAKEPIEDKYRTTENGKDIIKTRINYLCTIRIEELVYAKSFTKTVKVQGNFSSETGQNLKIEQKYLFALDSFNISGEIYSTSDYPWVWSIDKDGMLMDIVNDSSFESVNHFSLNTLRDYILKKKKMWFRGDDFDEPSLLMRSKDDKLRAYKVAGVVTSAVKYNDDLNSMYRVSVELKPELCKIIPENMSSNKITVYCNTELSAGLLYYFDIVESGEHDETYCAVFSLYKGKS